MGQAVFKRIQFPCNYFGVKLAVRAAGWQEVARCPYFNSRRLLIHVNIGLVNFFSWKSGQGFHQDGQLYLQASKHFSQAECNLLVLLVNIHNLCIQQAYIFFCILYYNSIKNPKEGREMVKEENTEKPGHKASPRSLSLNLQAVVGHSVLCTEVWHCPKHAKQ